MSSLHLDWCSHEAAKYAVEHWHYSRCLSKGGQNYIGVWETDRFIGTIVFGRSSSPDIGKAYGLTQWGCVELTRVALADHSTPVSRIVGQALRMLRKHNPSIRLVVSFADPRQGHVGSIYQAGNWIYVGRSNPRREFLLSGKWRTDVAAWRKKTTRTPSRRIDGKYKYLYPLDVAMRAQIEPLRKPYPKRASEASSDVPPVQGGEDGAAPILTLHERT